MEEQVLSPVAVTHLLQQTLRSLCIHDNSQWVYAVFWRILPRNFPPPKLDSHGGAYDRSRGNRRNWILVWEDGFCNFAASSNAEMKSSEDHHYSCSSSAYAATADQLQQFQGGLQPELFFKMSHEIYNYGEGFIGKVAADRSHKWIYKEASANEQEINFLSSWHNSADSYPRTWEAQFQSGIKTIALVAVSEGVVQLGAVNKVTEDLGYVMLLRKKMNLIESIPGVLLPHPSSSAFPYKAADHLFATGYGGAPPAADQMWHYQQYQGPPIATAAVPPPLEGSYHHHDHHHHHMNYNMMKITPSMSSLEALLSKLPSVVPSLDHQRVPVPPLCSTGGAGGVYHHPDSPHLIMLTSNYNRTPPNLELQADQKVQKQDINYEHHQDQEHHNHEDPNEEEEEQVVRAW